jgi:tetratricopeptide (TPR) repeat protein
MIRHEAPPEGCETIQGDALHTVLVHLMRGLAGEKPLLWVVDDLHFAPPDIRQMVLALARAVEGHPVLILGTTRPGLPEDEMAHFSRLGSFRRLPLPRLGARHVIELLKGAFRSEALAVKLGGMIALKSDGVPFFVFEMIRGLREGLFLEELPDGTYVETRMIEDIEVPGAVRDLIAARLRDLSDDDRALLDVAAVLGFGFDPDLVACVRDMKRVLVLERLAAIERRSGVVRTSGDGYRFDHHQIQEVIYGDLSPPLRREYHALLAEAHVERASISNRDPGELSGEQLVFLCTHHLKGSRPGNSLTFLGPALDHLAEAYRNDTALDLANLALAVSGLLASKERIDVLLRKSRLLDHLGRREEEREILDEAVRLADESADDTLRARSRNRLGTHLWSISDYEPALSWFDEARGYAKAAQYREGEASSLNGTGLVCWNMGRHAEAREHFETALEICREIGDRRGEALVTGNLGNVLRDLGRYEDAAIHYERDLAIATEIGNRRVAAIAMGNLGIATMNLGRYEEAAEHLTRALAVNREIGYRQGEVLTTGSLGNVLSALGRYGDAIAQYERYIAVSREIDYPRGEMIARTNLGTIQADLGDPEGALGNLDACYDQAREFGDRLTEGYGLAKLGDLARQTGESDRAERLYAEGLAIFRDLALPPHVANTLVSLGRLLAEEARPEDARLCLQEALSIGRELDAAQPVLLATCHLALMPDGKPSLALEALRQHEGRLPCSDRMEARFLLFKATGERAHLEEAHRLLGRLRDHAPEECRETMVSKVPLHGDIVAAWEEHGGESV